MNLSHKSRTKLCVCLILLVNSSLSADTKTWVPSGSGYFTSGSNWSPTGPPGQYDTGNITNAGTAIIRNGDTIHVGTLNVGADGDEGRGFVAQSEAPTSCEITYLRIGNETQGSGRYSLGAGVLNAHTMSVWGTGTIDQTGGSLLFHGSASPNYLSIYGTYNLSGGSLRMMSVNLDERIGSEYSGQGCFNQTGGTNVGGYVKVGQSPGLTGKYEMSGGSLYSSHLYVGYAGIGSFLQTEGTVRAVSVTVGNTNGSAGILQLTPGRIEGTNLTVASASGSTGTLTVAKEATLELEGDFTLGNGGAKLEIELASSSDFTQITADYGELGSNATLYVDCLSFRPKRYEDFPIVSTASGATGTFASITSSITIGLHGDPPFEGNASAEGYDIMFDGFTGGDANGDDQVSLIDLGVLSLHWGQTGKTWEEGDFNGDGTVGLIDLGILSSNWGWSGSPGKSYESLPELTDKDGDGDFDIDDVNLILDEYGLDQ